MELLIYFVLFAMFGIAQEVLFRGLLSKKRTDNFKLYGVSSAWMLPIYGSIIFIVLFVQTYFSSLNLIFRGLIYMILIYALEYVSGYILRLFNIEVWNYNKNETYCTGNKVCIHVTEKRKHNLNGLICLNYAPIWFVEGLIAEWLYLFLQTHLII